MRRPLVSSMRWAVQPIVANPLGANAGFRWGEILARPQHLPLVDFLDQARKQGKLHLVDECALAVAHRVAHAWDRISVNIAPTTIVQCGTRYLKTVEKYGLNGRLCIEIVETGPLDIPSLRKFIDEATAQGVTVAIDDFGSGSSNFSAWLKTTPSVIKFDGTILGPMNTRVDVKRLEAAIRFCHDLDASVVVEKVENAASARSFWALGIDYAQGFFDNHRPALIDEDEL